MNVKEEEEEEEEEGMEEVEGVEQVVLAKVEGGVEPLQIKEEEEVEEGT